MKPHSQIKPGELLQPGDLLTDVEASEIYNVSLQTLRNWRWRGEGPRFVKIGLRTVRYRRADLTAFIEGGEVDA